MGDHEGDHFFHEQALVPSHSNWFLCGEILFHHISSCESNWWFEHYDQ